MCISSTSLYLYSQYVMLSILLKINWETFFHLPWDALLNLNCSHRQLLVVCWPWQLTHLSIAQLLFNLWNWGRVNQCKTFVEVLELKLSVCTLIFLHFLDSTVVVYGGKNAKFLIDLSLFLIGHNLWSTRNRSKTLFFRSYTLILVTYSSFDQNQSHSKWLSSQC